MRPVADLIRTLDRIEADLRKLEHRVHSVRVELRETIDPLKERKDLGFWEDEGG